jgi:hypothetical protein
MSRALRISLVLAAVVAAAVAFAALRPNNDAVSTQSESPGAETPPTAAVEHGTPRPAPTRRPPLLTARSPRTLTVQRGETVAFRVRHPTEEELHVHGYDISRRLPAGRTVTVRFPARIEGIFDVELENSHTPLGRVRVEP